MNQHNTNNVNERTHLLLPNLTLYKIIFLYIIITTVRVRVTIWPYLTVFGSSAVGWIAVEHGWGGEATQHIKKSSCFVLFCGLCHRWLCCYPYCHKAWLTCKAKCSEKENGWRSAKENGCQWETQIWMLCWWMYEFRLHQRSMCQCQAWGKA